MITKSAFVYASTFLEVALNLRFLFDKLKSDAKTKIKTEKPTVPLP